MHCILYLIVDYYSEKWGCENRVEMILREFFIVYVFNADATRIRIYFAVIFSNSTQNLKLFRVDFIHYNDLYIPIIHPSSTSNDKAFERFFIS